MLASCLSGGFWSEPTSEDNTGFWTDLNNTNTEDDNAEGADEPCCRSYRAHFIQSEHFNFCGVCSVAGPLVLSLKLYSDHVRVILRLGTSTRHQAQTTGP